jgi:hypothetical protein
MDSTPDSNSNGRRVRLADTDAVVPGVCACCAEPASSSKVERELVGSRSLIVPYCTRCLRHASARTTRGLSAFVASVLISVTLAFGLPLAWQRAPLLVAVLLTLALSFVPLGIRMLGPRKPSSGHSAVERAVWWEPDGTVACTHARWAEQLARSAPGSEVSAADVRERRFAPWFAAGPLVAVIAGASGWIVHHPLVRVLNLGDSRMTVLVDGRPVASVDPTSAESPSAGVELRMPTGEHRLVALGADGSTLADSTVVLRSGSRHLYVPAAPAYCFWLEETHYGRETESPDRVEALEGQPGFWVLPDGIDTWFAPNPPPAAEDSRSSGGALLALRQARCEQAPASVRR